MGGVRPVSEIIWQQIQGIAPEPFQVGVAKDYSVADLESGALQSLGVHVLNGEVVVRDRVIPSGEPGSWSDWNVNGQEKPRRDLPKVSRPSIGWVYPYGNKNAGKVTAFRTVKAYPRETLHGHGLAILISAGAKNNDTVRIGFRVDRAFPANTERADPDLVLALSMLREHVGNTGVISADTDPQTWTKQQSLTWELLPQGQDSEDVLNRIVGNLKLANFPDVEAEAKKRNDVIWKLKPREVATGHGEFSRYVAYIFRDDLVVLENLTYGNALYVMFENWRDLSQRSRLDLLSDSQAEYMRIVHQGSWKSELQKVIRASGKRSNR
ncbi:hypothetical protein ACTAQJ_14670 [Arthrobacter sp. alpha11c]